jgi:hypothetical protein
MHEKENFIVRRRRVRQLIKNLCCIHTREKKGSMKKFLLLKRRLILGFYLFLHEIPSQFGPQPEQESKFIDPPGDGPK